MLDQNSDYRPSFYVSIIFFNHGVRPLADSTESLRFSFVVNYYGEGARHRSLPSVRLTRRHLNPKWSSQKCKIWFLDSGFFIQLPKSTTLLRKHHDWSKTHHAGGVLNFDRALIAHIVAGGVPAASASQSI